MASKSDSHSLIEKTRAALISLGVSQNSRMLIGVSGGPDSIALLHLLASLKSEGTFRELTVAHINHKLRDVASDEDESLVRAMAARLKLPLEFYSVDTLARSQHERNGIEETARKIRYEFFAKLASDRQFDFVITAHTANDQAETVLMNMVRGAGVSGLAGIPAKRKLGQAFVIRPWLGITREAIVQYIIEHHIDTAHDASNDALTYQRNRVRHLVMPALDAAYPDRTPARSIAGLAKRMAELNKFLNSFAEEKLETLLQPDGSILLTSIQNFRGYLLHAVVNAWLRHNQIDYRLSDHELRAIEQFIFFDTNSLLLRHGITLYKNEAALRIEQPSIKDWTVTPIRVGESCDTPMGRITTRIVEGNTIDRNPDCAAFDAEQLSEEVFLIRPWHPGDRIPPFGMSGKTKLVSDILNEAGISNRRKKGYPIVARASNPEAILWIPGLRRAEEAAITDYTKFQVVFEWIPEV